MIVDFVVMLVIALLVAAACVYMRIQKKKGNSCCGCPHAGACAKKTQGGCGA